MRRERLLLATGTYGFAALVRTVCASLRALAERYRHITIQYGTSIGEDEVSGLLAQCADDQAGDEWAVFGPRGAVCTVQAFSIIQDFRSAIAAHDVVLTHGGTGTIIEALQEEKVVVSVPNTELEGNHQSEFLEHIRESVSVETLGTVVGRLLEKRKKGGRVVSAGVQEVWGLIDEVVFKTHKK